MNEGKIVLIALVSGLWIATVAAVIYAIRRRRRLNAEWHSAADYEAIRAYANDQIFLELLRLLKHSILCALIFITPDDPPPLVEVRNVGIAAVGLLIGFTSAWNLYRRRRRYEFYRRLPIVPPVEVEQLLNRSKP